MVNLSRTGVVNLNRTKLVRQNRTEVVNEIGLCTILKEFYKDDPMKFETVEKNKEAMLSKAKIESGIPILTSLDSKGFYYLLPVTISMDNIYYTFSLITGYIRLNKYSYGISGSVEKNNKPDVVQFIKNIINQNPS